MLTLQIKEKEIENLTPEEEFVRGTVGAKCQINFDEFWQSYNKYIVFKRVGYEPINFMVDTLENEIEIPYTILAESGEFKIGVFGTTETETLPTLYSKDIKILYGTDTHGTTPPTYIPSEIDQLRLSKQDKLVSGENIKTVNGESVLGSGNIKIQVEVDQTYTPESENAQSGKAVAEALSGYVMAEVGKGLSSNDFTNEDKEKLYSALQNEDIDKTYNPTSENAQSGKAVAEALSTEQKRADNTFANALKGTKSDTAMLIDDVSPVTHEMGVKVRGKNLFDTSKLQNVTFETYSDIPCFSYYDNENYFIYTDNFIKDTQYTFTTKAYREDGVINKPIAIKFVYTDGTSQSQILSAGEKGSVTTEAGKTLTKITGNNAYWLKCYIDLSVTQLELGTTATDYTPYVPDLTAVKVKKSNAFGEIVAEYTPNADGTVNGVTSLYPNTTLMTDTGGVTIDCEYNRDINKAFAELQAAIISLGGNV